MAIAVADIAAGLTDALMGASPSEAQPRSFDALLGFPCSTIGAPPLLASRGLEDFGNLIRATNKYMGRTAQPTRPVVEVRVGLHFEWV
jgi:hypothetical protein